MGILNLNNPLYSKVVTEGIKKEKGKKADAQEKAMSTHNTSTSFNKKAMRVKEKKDKANKVKLRKGDKKTPKTDDHKDMLVESHSDLVLNEFSIPFVSRFLQAKNSRELNKKIVSKLDDIKDLKQEIEEHKELLSAKVSDSKKEGYQSKINAMVEDINIKKQEIDNLITQYRQKKRKEKDAIVTAKKKVVEMYEDYDARSKIVAENLDDRLFTMQITMDSMANEYSPLMYNYFMLEYRALTGARRTAKKVAKGVKNLAVSGAKSTAKSVSSAVKRSTKSDSEKKVDEDKVNAARTKWVKNKKADIETLKGQMKKAESLHKMNLVASIKKRIVNTEKDIADEKAHLEKVKAGTAVNEDFSYVIEKANMNFMYRDSAAAHAGKFDKDTISKYKEKFNKELANIKTKEDKTNVIKDLRTVKKGLEIASSPKYSDKQREMAIHNIKGVKYGIGATALFLLGSAIPGIGQIGSLIALIWAGTSASVGVQAGQWAHYHKNVAKNVDKNKKHLKDAIKLIDKMISQVKGMKLNEAYVLDESYNLVEKAHLEKGTDPTVLSEAIFTIKNGKWVSDSTMYMYDINSVDDKFEDVAFAPDHTKDKFNLENNTTFYNKIKNKTYKMIVGFVGNTVKYYYGEVDGVVMSDGAKTSLKSVYNKTFSETS